jgi:hypothetical protein
MKCAVKTKAKRRDEKKSIKDKVIKIEEERREKCH